jgi:phospholipase C
VGPLWLRNAHAAAGGLAIRQAQRVDHTLTDQSSILRFVEDNWLFGERIQPGGSFDTIAGTLNNMFDFDAREDEPRKLILDEQTGAVVSVTPSDHDDDHDRR